MKFIKQLTIGISVLMSSMNAFSNPPNHKITDFHANLPAHEFVSKFNDGLSVLLNEYRSVIKTPLDARILNIAEPQTYKFLQGNTNFDYSQYFVAVRYYPDYVVNQNKTSFCFILYNDKKREIVSNYYQQFQHKDIAISYIIAHEFGHCINNHQLNVRGLSDSLNEQKNESLADIIAYSYFISKGYPDISKEILRFSKIEKTTLIHNSYSDLKQYVDYIEKNNISLLNKNIVEIYDISLSFIYQLTNPSDNIIHSYNNDSLIKVIH